MRQADRWEAPDDSTISGVASRIVRDETRKPPNIFHYDARSAQRGRMNAGRKAHEQAVARRKLA
jgi:hypothetical protein